MLTRILIVDDQPDFSLWLKRHLEATGRFIVQEENDSLAAIKSAREFWPDLVILDVMMPHLDGSEVASRLREDRLLRDVPVLFLTALVSRREAPDGSFSSGGQTFLPKVTPISKLVQCITLLRSAELAHVFDDQSHDAPHRPAALRRACS